MKGELNGMLEEVHHLTSYDLYLKMGDINPLNTELNPICFLLALLGAHHFLHVSRIRVKSLTIISSPFSPR